jgi:hypothetical protein
MDSAGYRAGRGREVQCADGRRESSAHREIHGNAMFIYRVGPHLHAACYESLSPPKEKRTRIKRTIPIGSRNGPQMLLQSLIVLEKTWTDRRVVTYLCFELIVSLLDRIDTWISRTDE